MKNTIPSIKKVAELTDKAILFHSLSGKDSMVLLDLIYPYFKDIICVFMFVVPDLSYNEKYKLYIKSKYPKVTKIIDTPHYSLPSWIKHGAYGCKKDLTVHKFSVQQINEYIRASNEGFEWTFYGFKQSDSMNRRLMLRTYEDNIINYKTKKCYPLSEWHNKDVLAYNQLKGLIKPMSYNAGQTSGDDVSNIDYLLWVKENSPSDLDKIFALFPMVKTKLFEYEYQKTIMDSGQ